MPVREPGHFKAREPVSGSLWAGRRRRQRPPEVHRRAPDEGVGALLGAWLGTPLGIWSGLTVAAGWTAHLLEDMCTGGVPLWWPYGRRSSWRGLFWMGVRLVRVVRLSRGSNRRRERTPLRVARPIAAPHGRTVAHEGGNT